MNDINTLEQLRNAGWVATDALFQRSDYSDKSDFNAHLAKLERGGQLQLRSGPWGREAALPGTTLPDEQRRNAKAPLPPAGTVLSAPLQAMQPLLEAPQHAARPTHIEISAPPAPTEPQAAPAEEPSMSKKSAPAPAARGAKREQVLGLLRQSPWTAAELAKACGLERSALLYHLNALRTDGLAKSVGAGVATTWEAARWRQARRDRRRREGAQAAPCHAGGGVRALSARRSSSSSSVCAPARSSASI